MGTLHVLLVEIPLPSSVDEGLSLLVTSVLLLAVESVLVTLESLLQVLDVLDESVSLPVSVGSVVVESLSVEMETVESLMVMDGDEVDEVVDIGFSGASMT